MEKGTILILVLIGLVLGLVLIGSELVKPFQGAAEYERSHVETMMEQERGKTDIENYRAIEKASTEATLVEIEAEKALIPTRVAFEAAQDMQDEAFREEQARQKVLDDRQAGLDQEAVKMELTRYAGIALITLIFIFLALGGFTLYNIANRRDSPADERQIPRMQLGYIPVTGQAQHPPEPNPVDAAENRFRSGRSNGHSHSGLGDQAPAPDDSSEPKYPFAI